MRWGYNMICDASLRTLGGIPVHTWCAMMILAVTLSQKPVYLLNSSVLNLKHKLMLSDETFLQVLRRRMPTIPTTARLLSVFVTHLVALSAELSAIGVRLPVANNLNCTSAVGFGVGDKPLNQFICMTIENAILFPAPWQ
jgi:hypothetical protein